MTYFDILRYAVNVRCKGTPRPLLPFGFSAAVERNSKAWRKLLKAFAEIHNSLALKQWISTHNAASAKPRISAPPPHETRREAAGGAVWWIQELCGLVFMKIIYNIRNR